MLITDHTFIRDLRVHPIFGVALLIIKIDLFQHFTKPFSKKASVCILQSTMEEVMSRFPHLIENIFNSLENKSIANSLKISRYWNYNLKSRKIVQIPKIKTTVAKFHSVNKAWNEIFDTATTETIIELGQAVEKFYQKNMNLNYFEGLTPLHVVAGSGHLNLYQKIHEKASMKYPKDDCEFLPLYYAAQNGHLDICQIIILESKSGDKNPVNKYGLTPLHGAARNGHTEVYQLIMTYAEDKNPKGTFDGTTPLHQAAVNGHMEICKLIVEKVENKNPADNKGSTPLHKAAKNGHIEIFHLIVTYVVDRNPRADNGWTPLHYAAEGNHIDICKLILESIEDKMPKTQDGTTPLTLASKNDHFELVYFLAAKHLKINE